MNKLFLFLGLTMALVLSNCSSADKAEDNADSISPSNADALTEVLVIPNAEVVNSPNLPPSSSPSVAPAVNHVDTNISYSAGGQIIIPSDVNSPVTANIAGVYIQVKGASTYFDVPINAATFNGTFSIPVNLPLEVGDGDFTLILKFYDTNGNISAITEVNIHVTQPTNCNTTKVSGGQGLTSNIFQVGNNSGMITISYDTFTVKDKIDVFQNGVWLGGTGPSTVRGTLRRPLSCNAATEALGYVGQNSQFVFAYNPGAGNDIEVVVSGCENGGTAWEYTFSCPETVQPGNGTFILNGSSFTGICQGTQSGQCTAESGKNVTLINSGGSKSVILYNMPLASSGSTSLVYFDTANCQPYIIVNDNGIYSARTNLTGSIVKTGANSFTFSTTFTDYDDIQRSISGSGSY
jgi:hypothetical protein